ncbi:MAG: preprotein translocase subunit SecE [Patescibacteria group bacterium]
MNNKIVKFLKEVHEEMGKVSWPTREEAVNLTLVVIGVALGITIFVGIVDELFRSTVRLLIQQ